MNLREQILEEVRVRPGIHKSKLHRVVGGAWGTVQHHIRHLVREGGLRQVSDGWRTHLFLAGDPDVERYVRVLAHLRPTPPVEQADKEPAKVQAPGRRMIRGPQQNGEDTRAAILKAVDENPGLNKSEATRALGIGWGCLGYHVKVLEEGYRLRVLRRGNDVSLFPIDLEADHVKWLGLLRDDTRRRLVFLLASGNLEPPSTQGLATRLGRSDRSIQRHLALLRDAELLCDQVNRPTERAAAFIGQVRVHAEPDFADFARQATRGSQSCY